MSSHWVNEFTKQLENAWDRQAFREVIDTDLALDAVAGWVLAVNLAAAETNDEMLDVVSAHLAMTAGPDGNQPTANLLHSAVLNLAVTFLKPALDALTGTEQDVRLVAKQMAAVVSADAAAAATDGATDE
jgi:hypothetical protein